MEKKIIASNKRAAHKYEIIEKVEAGIELRGCEVKSLRENKVDLKDGFARIDPAKGEVFLHNLYLSPYDKASYNNEDPKRVRRLLLHKRQIAKFFAKMKEKGYTLIALNIYFNEKGKAKVEIALAKGRKMFDQREKIKNKETEARLRKISSVKNA